MITTAEFDDFVAPGIRARQAQRAHRSLCTGIDETYHFNRRHTLDYQARQFAFGGGRCAKTETIGGCLGDSLKDRWIDMSQNHWSPGLHIIEIAIAVLVE